MKKLVLNKTTFSGSEVLSRAQLKKVLGGSESLTTSSKNCPLCWSSSDCPDSACPSCMSQNSDATSKGACGKSS